MRALRALNGSALQRCGAAMLTSIVLPRWNVVAMVLVSVLIPGERLEHPARPSGRWRGRGKLKHLVARTRIRLNE